jgi:hypothetical protein
MTAGAVDRTTIDATTGAAGTATGYAAIAYAYIVTYNAALLDPLGHPAPMPPPAVTLGSTTAPYSIARPADSTDVLLGNRGRMVLFQSWADTANFIAQLIVYMQANGTAHVTTEQLGRLPSPLTIGTVIDYPPLPVDIPIT